MGSAFDHRPSIRRGEVACASELPASGSPARLISRRWFQPLLQSAMLPPPPSWHTLGAHVRANAMLLAGKPHSDTLRPVGPSEDATAVLFVTFVLSVEGLAIWPLKPPLTVHAALDPLPSVTASIGPGENSFALQRVLAEVSRVARTTFPREGASAMFLPVRKLATVLTSVRQPLRARAMLSALNPSPFVARTVGLRQLALAVCCAGHPVSCVHSAVGPTLRAEAMWLPILLGLARVDATVGDEHVLHVVHLVRPAARDMTLGELIHNVLLLVDVESQPLQVLPANASCEGYGHGLAGRRGTDTGLPHSAGVGAHPGQHPG
mmetsp:Transcript_16379/g.42299  ORF Transcript_16379/g.42299 Transcript_16379/m.42299 type:complete len:321 (+) Transcript_16379:107-1069(+)